MLNPIKALVGSDEWKYHYEQKYQYERPAVMTGTYGEDIPFVGPLVAATVGKLLKPRKLIRQEEWALGGGEYKHRPKDKDLEPAYELGGLGPGAPVDPEEATQVFNELMYKRREAVGLVGFAEGAIQKAITGREETFANLQTMSTMGKETGSEYWLWSHLNLGGFFATSELIRRFIPRTRSYLETYNPLRNTMPSWMPDDYFLDLKYGNPFDKIPEAEIRLPGPGFAALYPEVEGLAPEKYPLAYRAKILGDVAMWSDEYKQTIQQAKANMSQMSDRERAIVRNTEEQVKQKKIRRDIKEYRFDSDKLEAQKVTITDVLSPRNVKTAEFGDMTLELQGVGRITKNMQEVMSRATEELQGKKVTVYTPSLESRSIDLLESGPRMKVFLEAEGTNYAQMMAQEGFVEAKPLTDEFEQLQFSGTERLIGAASERLLHGVETPLEYLTPVSPASKFIRQRSAIEEYIASEAIGTMNAFWDKPIENFLKPAANMTLYSLGFTGVPEEIRQRRNINQYFDMLKWTKAKKLEREAIKQGDREMVSEQRQAQQETLFGVDAFGSPVNILRAMPRRERDFFTYFSQAQSEEERSQILQLVPENERRIYLTQWLRQEEAAARAKNKAKVQDDRDNRTLVASKLARKSEGFEITQDLEEQWLEETGGQIPFDDWIREKKAEEYFSTHSLPGAEWLGFHPAVDLDDVKLKYVEMAGLSHFDFDLWGAQKASLARKPYIDEDLIEQMDNKTALDNVVKTQINAKALGKIYSNNSNVQMQRIAADVKETYDISIVDGRENLINETYKYMGTR
jgi:hypothetical protein